MWWNVNFFWALATLCRHRAGRTSKHVAKCKFTEARRTLFARNESQPSKTGVKIVILKVLMQAWHGSQTVITVGKLRFFNVRRQMQTFKNWCKIAILSILTRRHNCFAGKKLCKIAIFQGHAQPFHARWLSIVKSCDFPTPAATLSHDMMAERPKLK